MTQSPILSCWCTTCRPPDPADPSSMRLALCPTCGNKRCPRAHNHALACTNSNAPGQPGSSWEHVRPIHETAACAPRLAGKQTAADREMLEMAAKAAGIAVVRSRLDDPACQDFLIRGSVRNQSQDLGPWNPLADDGDALRLAVTLRISVNFGKAVDPAQSWEGVLASRAAIFGSSPRVEFAENHCVEHGDSAAATRRAIVQAAAAIGRAMP